VMNLAAGTRISALALVVREVDEEVQGKLT
jgi:hypothetical protein